MDLDGDDNEGNLQSILKVLSELQYRVQTYCLKSSDFGIPQRRVRIWIVGFHAERNPEASFERMTQTLSTLQIRCQPPVSQFMNFVGPIVD